MNLTQRISFLLKTAWNDLFGEDPQGGEPTLGRAVAGETTAERLGGLLDQSQGQLDALRLELANALTRQKRIAGSARGVLRRLLQERDSLRVGAMHGGSERVRRRGLRRGGLR